MQKLSIGLKVLNCSPSHTRFTIFSALIPSDENHEDMTRASLGGPLTLRNAEFTPFVLRLRPHIITVDEQALFPTVLDPLYFEQSARGEWDYHKWVLRPIEKQEESIQPKHDRGLWEEFKTTQDDNDADDLAAGYLPGDAPF